MVRRFRRLWIFLFATFLLGCERDASQEMVGHPFPNFSLPQPGGSDSVKLEALKGSPVLVVFWATWCGYCLDEVEELRQVLSRHGADGLKIVGLSIDETPAPVPLMVSKHSIPYPVGTGALPLFDSLGLKALPHSFLLDAQGNVARSFFGAFPASAFDEAIAELKPKK